jgi:hypothetical protein
MHVVMATERLAARFSHPRSRRVVRAVTDRVGRLRDDPSRVAQPARLRLDPAGQPTR